MDLPSVRSQLSRGLPEYSGFEGLLADGGLDVLGGGHQVRAHLPPCPFGVPGLHATQYLLVLPQGSPGAAGPRGAHAAAVPQQLDDRVEHGEKHAVARAARQEGVELHVGVDVPLGRVDGGLHPVKLDPHLPHLLRAGAPGGETRDLDLQDLAYLQKLPEGLRLDAEEHPEGLAYRVGAAAADHGTPAMLDADEAASLEKVQRFAYHRAADAQTRDELTLGRKAFPRSQPAGKDHVQELISRPIPQPGASGLLTHPGNIVIPIIGLVNRALRSPLCAHGNCQRKGRTVTTIPDIREPPAGKGTGRWRRRTCTSTARR